LNEVSAIREHSVVPLRTTIFDFYYQAFGYQGFEPIVPSGGTDHFTGGRVELRRCRSAFIADEIESCLQCGI